ncbi:MAG: hypothetical protein WBD10_00260 [Acidobacteriaceae bacterium]
MGEPQVPRRFASRDDIVWGVGMGFEKRKAQLLGCAFRGFLSYIQNIKSGRNSGQFWGLRFQWVA